MQPHAREVRAELGEEPGRLPVLPRQVDRALRAPKESGLISPGLYVAAALFLFVWVGFAAVALGRRNLTR